jgi:hypothetical protein
MRLKSASVITEEFTMWVKKKVKQSLYTSWRRLGGEEV